MDTDKVVVEVPAPASGYLLRIDTTAGTAKVDQVIAWIGEQGEMPALTQDIGPCVSQAVALVPSRPKITHEGGHAATPAARRRARELGVDLTDVQGTGPGGRITERDVEAGGVSAQE
jgi:pyruvate dehydrogenase E2 component (dihydrolipoamide acetyltransferase)